jgi:DNA-binding XRE family transcriptional regulator
MVQLTEKAEYPPKLYNCKLEELRLNHPDKPTIEVLAHAVGITPVTLTRIQEGCDVKLSNAFKLAKIFGVSVTDIWEPRTI